MKRIIAVLLAAVSIFLVTGCEKRNVKTMSAGTVSLNNGKSEEKQGGTLSLYSYKPDTLCPIFSDNNANIQMLGMVYEGLVKLDKMLLPQPSLASEWDVSKDGHTWTVTLRDNAKWHDGSNFTAQDVWYTISQIKADKDNFYSYNVSDIVGIKTINNHKIEFTLSKPKSNFMNLMYFPIVKKQSAAINKEKYLPLGTGPYIYDKKSEGNMYVLHRNDSWWGGTSNIDTINVKLMPDKDTALYALTSGNLDFALTETNDWSKFIDSSTTKYISFNTEIYNFIGVNHKRGILGMSEVRKAISYIIDRNGIVNRTLMNCGCAASSPVNPNWYVYDMNSANVESDTQKAKKVLEQNGWKIVNDKYKKVDKGVTYTLTFDILVNEENGTRQQVATDIKNYLTNFGMDVTVTSVPFEKYMSNINSMSYDAFIGSYNLADDLDFSVLFGEGNMFGYEDEEMDKIIANTQKQISNDGTVAAYRKFITEFEKKNPVIGIYFDDKVVLYNTNVAGTLTPYSHNVYSGIEKLYKKDDK